MANAMRTDIPLSEQSPEYVETGAIQNLKVGICLQCFHAMCIAGQNLDMECLLRSHRREVMRPLELGAEVIRR